MQALSSAEHASLQIHLIFAENIQVRATVPVDRTRFIAVAIESDVQANWTPSKRFEILIGGSTCTLGQENMWFHGIPHCLQDQVSLTDEELELYASTKRLPKTARNPEQALKARIIGRHDPLPATTLMRSYSQQHKFKSVMRGEAKLLGNLREDDTGRPRLFSQVEIITATGVTNGINMPVDLKQGCAQAGNAITQIHALAGFWVIIESKDATGSGDFDTFRQCVDIFRKCRITASSEAIVAEDRCMIGFNTHDPTYAIAHNECIQQLLHEETFSGELDMQAWYKGTIVPFDMKIKSGGSLRIVCAQAPGNDEISPTIPFQVDKEENDRTLPNSRWSHITTQPGPKTICRVWEHGILIAEFPIDTEMLKDLPIQRGVIDFQQIHGTQEKMQIFIKGIDGPTECVTVEPHQKIQQIAEMLPLGDIKSYKVHYGARLLDMQTTVAQAGIHNHATIHFTTRSKGGGKHAKETQLEGVKRKPKKKTTYQSPPLDSLTIAVGSFLLSNGDQAPIGGSFCLSGVAM